MKRKSVDYNILVKSFKEDSIGNVLEEYDLSFEDAFKLCLEGAENRKPKKEK